MNLRDIETFVLVNIKHTRYNLLSASSASDDEREDFSLLHRCVFLARNEIKLKTDIPSILKRSTDNPTVASKKSYSLPTDFDVPVKVRFRTGTGSEYDLTRVYPSNLVQKLNGTLTTATGTPDFYMLFGNTSDVGNIEFYKIPDVATYRYDLEYKPILSNLTTSSDEDLIMHKYPQTVIKLASAYAFQLIKTNQEQFDKWYLLGTLDFPEIDRIEKDADSHYKEIPDSLTRARRGARFTK